MKFSIIIPCKEIDKNVERCLERCLGLKGDYEIILLPDKKDSLNFDSVRVICTGNVKPSLKRNIGVREARNEILAFIDSDAYPREDWLSNCEKYFREDVGAVGGPNLTPKEASFLERLSGDVLESLACGIASLRYRKLKRSFVINELPSCNLFVRKDIFEKVGGFDNSLLTAEDSKLCFEIRRLGKKIVYGKDVVVYHHRRKFPFQHLKQVFVYGRDKGFLVRKGFFNFYYFLPSFFVLFLVFGGLLSFNEIFKRVYFFVIIFYLLFVVFFSFNVKKVYKWLLIFVGIILTHFFYGLGFLYGLIGVKFKRFLR